MNRSSSNLRLKSGINNSVTKSREIFRSLFSSSSKPTSQSIKTTMASSTLDFVPAKDFPKPTIIPPLKEPHTSSIIFLHGRGDSSSSFSYIAGEPASRADISKTFRHRFPHTRFIFPQTKLRRVSQIGALMNEWFDLWNLFKPDERQDLQKCGLKEAGEFVRELIEKEKEEGIKESKILLCGISQGCAVALHALMGYEGRLGGFVGFSGWFPFSGQTMDFLQDAQGSYSTKRARAVNWLRKEIQELPEMEIGEAQDADVDGDSPSQPIFQVLKTPVFLGHSTDDDKVPIGLGEKIRDMCELFGMDVKWKTYDYGHWYMAPEELEDVVDWIAEKGWELDIDDGQYEPREEHH